MSASTACCLRPNSSPNQLSSSEPSETSYYDLPLHEDCPGNERAICEYLKAHSVRMSHPSVKSVSGVLGTPKRTPNFLESKRKQFLRGFKNYSLSVLIPQSPNAVNS
eukprot:TRINITY_DN17150_c0_g1_i6.p1 TRINITY_DN17150_c0_g1~~TRINITY_DN17150_c0_g1_i6.p1  ORF type:complete len:107 (-),score=11.82 TRINITY_DN17150_c0_g1_i6:146-466(-)